MSSALIGHTGFVGGSLLRQANFDGLYNSSNIGGIGKRDWELVVCAAPSAVKWKANKFPEEDREHVDALIRELDQVRTAHFVLISTVDVYPAPVGVDEETPIDVAVAMPYGRHRFLLEEAVRERFASFSVVRLPQLFGPGLKKNFLFDLIHDNVLHLTHCRSVFQFYDTERLWHDICRARDSAVGVVNLAVEPVDAATIARHLFDADFTNETEAPPVHYDVRSARSGRLGYPQPYLMGREECLERMAGFVRKHRGAAST